MCMTYDLGSGTAKSHGGAMKIVPEYEIRESEVEVLEEEKQPWHIARVYTWRQRTGMRCAL